MMQTDIEKYVFAKLREASTLMTRFTERDGRKLPQRQLFLSLKKYVDEHLEGKKTERFLIMPGLRGVGKTTLVWQTYRHLIDKKVPVNHLLYLSVDEIQSFLGKMLGEVLQTYVAAVHRTSIAELKERVFLFIDEAHFDPDWSKTLKVVYDKNPNIFILATGSAAIALTADTDTTRRAFIMPALPVNFLEYLILKYDIYPPRGTRERIRTGILDGSDEAVKDLASLRTNLQAIIKPPPDIALEDYVYEGGFAFGIFEKHPLHKCADVIERIIYRDLPTIRPVTRENLAIAGKILQFIAMQEPGSFPQLALAASLGSSAGSINTLLGAFEKAQTIFSVPPYGGAGKTVRKPWKYYFATPTLATSLLDRLGHLDKTDRKMYGTLVEHLVASYFYRMKITTHRAQGLFYDSQEGGADFLIEDGNRIIPVEVTVGASGADQVKRSIKKYNSPHGILISSQESVRKENGIIYLPLWFFAFL